MINKIYSISIKTKITITILIILLMFSIGIILIIKNSLSKNINSLTLAITKDLIQVNEPLIIKSLIEDDSWSIYKFLKNLSKIELIKSAGFLDINNMIVAHSDTKAFSIGQKVPTQFNENLIVIPLKSENVTLGKFIIETNNNSIATMFNELKIQLMFSILFATVLSFLFAYLISNRILKRLDILSFNAKKIEEKKWEEIKPLVSKEVDEITIFQNSMEMILKKLQYSIENEEVLKKFYQDILESLDELIISCDNDYNIKYENNHSLKRFITHNNSFDSDIKKKLIDVISKNASHFIMDYKDSDEKIIYILVMIKKVQYGYALSFSDITTLKKLQEKQCLINSFEIVGELSSVVVHEIKNYLLPAQLLIEQDYLDNEDKIRIERIISKIDLLVNDFLKSGKPIDTSLSSKINVNNSISTIIALLDKQIASKKLNLKVTLSENIEIFMAYTDFETVMVNLLKNAIEESFEGKDIYINLLSDEHYIIMEITDFGDGIDTNILQNINKPFFTTKGEKGSGIGLYVTYKIIYLYNGFINVDSKKGNTTFSIHIPKVLN